MTNNENVAVIMSVYHRDSLEFLRKSVESIVCQQNVCAHFFIFIDGAVSREIHDYLNDLSNLDRFFLFFGKENKGLACALNYLIDQVLSFQKFTYIARMDSDDVARPERLSKQLVFLKENPNIDVCGSFCHEFGSKVAMDVKRLPLAHAELADFSIARCPFVHPSVVFRSTVFASGIRYPIDTSLTEDMALWFELLMNGYRFGNIPEVLIDYRLNAETVARRKGFSKGISEVSIRLKYMLLLKKTSVRNIALILSRLVLHALPVPLLEYCYLRFR